MRVDFRATLEEIETHDLVLGSRYLHGITVVNWPLKRLVLSVGANRYAGFVTGMSLKDCTGGFKCFRRSTLEQLPLDRIKSDGYSFQIEMNYHTWKRGFRIVEMPITFTDRLVGQSFLKVFFAFILGSPILFILGDITENLEDYLGAGLTWVDVGLAYLFNGHDSSFFCVLPGTRVWLLSSGASDRVIHHQD